MYSNIIFGALLATLLPQTLATPTPSKIAVEKRGQKHWDDNRPAYVPRWTRIGAEPLECGDECSYMCWSFKKTTVSVSGNSNFAQYAGFHAHAKLGSDEVVPNHDWRCMDCNDLTTPDTNGWSMTLKTSGAPMEGPLPVNIRFPWEVALFDANTKGPFMSDQVIGDDGFECDVWQCGGGLNPMSCRNCKFHQSFDVYHATPIKEDCSYWEDE